METYYGSELQAQNLHDTAVNLAVQVAEKEKSYKGSWQKRGGVGAFMMASRKWDRIEKQAECQGYDVWKIWEALESIADGKMNDIEDLAGYLLLIINEKRIHEKIQAQHPECDCETMEPFCTPPRDYVDFEFKDTPTYNVPYVDIPVGDPAMTEANLLGALGQLTPEQRESLGDCFEDMVVTIRNFQPAAELPVTTEAVNDKPAKNSWEESHPSFYPSANPNLQCSICHSTFVSNKGRLIQCNQCGHKWDNKQWRQPSAYDQKFPQVFVNRDKNKPTTEELSPG